MHHPQARPRRQLALNLDQEARHQPTEHVRADVVQVLADLLLEALGQGTTVLAAGEGGTHEPKDHA